MSQHVQPMLHSGGVRAFSHLPAKRQAADPAGQLSQHGAQALGHQFQRTEPEGPATPPADGISAAKASGVFEAVRQQFNRDDSPHFMDEDGNLRPRDEARQQDSPSPRDPRSPQFGAGAPPRPAWSAGHAAGADSSRSPRTPSSASDATRPWYLPPITPEDLDPQHFDDDATAGSHSALKGRPEVQDLVYRTHGESTPKPGLQDLLYRYNGSQEETNSHRKDYSRPVADTRNDDEHKYLASRPDTSAQLAKDQQDENAARPPSNTPPPAATATGRHPAMESQKKAVPTTTVRIGNYPAYEKPNASQKEIDEWNTTFRETYGKLAADAARKHGVPARLLAALSANEVAAPNWNALNAFADRNTLLTKSVGPLQISSKTALKYKLIPIDNEFYGLPKSDIWGALHDPDFRYAGESSTHAPDAEHKAPSRDLPTMTPGQKLLLNQTPYPTSIYDPNGQGIIHDYLDNPATSFDAGAKLLKIYLQRLVDDYKSGAYLNYSKDFRDLNGFSLPNDPIHKDLKTLASGDKDAIYNLHFSPRLAKALAMMWNNGENIVYVEDIFNQSPNAHAHGANMRSQQVNQDDLIPPEFNNVQPMPLP